MQQLPDHFKIYVAQHCNADSPRKRLRKVVTQHPAAAAAMVAIEHPTATLSILGVGVNEHC
eukprot:304-Heterococcus_DN1.PRE.2